MLYPKAVMVMILIVVMPSILVAQEKLEYISIESFKASVGLLTQKEFYCEYANGGVSEMNIRGRVRAQFHNKDKSFFIEIHLAPNKKAHVHFDSTNYNQPPRWAASWPQYYRDRQSFVYRGYQGVRTRDFFIIYNFRGNNPIRFSYSNNLGVQIRCGEI